MGIAATLETLLSAANQLLGTIDGKLRNKANASDVYTREDLNDAQRTLGSNAATASKLRVSRIIRLAGDATGQVGFDGAADAAIVVTVPGLADKANKTEVVTPEQMNARFEAIIGVAPEFLDQFSEIAAAIGNDPNFAATMFAQLASKADKASTLTSAQIEGLYLQRTARAADAAMLGGNIPAFYASAASVKSLEENIIDALQKLAMAFNDGATNINSAG